MKCPLRRLVVTFAVVAIGSPVAVSANNGSISCDLAVAELVERVEKSTGVIGFFSQKRDSQHGLISIGISPGRAQVQGVPTRASREQTARAQNVMNSPKLMAAWATTVLRSCDDVHEVSFGMTGSGHYIPFYRFPDVAIRKGICVPDIHETSTSKAPFGTYDCTK